MERLVTLYRNFAGCEPESVSPLPISGSARRYFRITGPKTVIGCIGSSLLENNAFFAIDRSFCSHGLNAPEVYAISSDGMVYIQEDLGDGQLFELLKPSIESGEFAPEQKEWLHGVMRALPSLQFKVGDGLDWGVCFPDREFNARMVNFDLNYFKYDFLKFTLVDFNEIKLQDDFDRLREDVLSFSGNTFMYRDLQARNVMIRDGQPWFIDFQGGRRGPVQYDLASFLWNAGTHFSASVRRELELTYLEALREFQNISEDEFYDRYRKLTLVRILQECGAYGFRGMVERKQLFIDCLPSVLGCIGELVSEPFARYPHLTDVLRRLSSQWDGNTNMPGFSISL